MLCGKRSIRDDMGQASAAAVIDARGIVTRWSEGARTLAGNPAEEAVLKAVMPQEPSDDVALLVRTRATGTDQVATWDIEPNPARVAGARQAATEQLTAWGLDEEAFVTELVVSELVTTPSGTANRPSSSA